MSGAVPFWVEAARRRRGHAARLIPTWVWLVPGVVGGVLIAVGVTAAPLMALITAVVLSGGWGLLASRPAALDVRLRRPQTPGEVVEKLVAASRRSTVWYEQFADHMRLAPLDLAMSYITRSDRIDEDRLRRMSPEFMTRYASRGTRLGGRTPERGPT